MSNAPATLSPAAEARARFLLGKVAEKVSLEGCDDAAGVGYVFTNPPAAKYPFAYAVWMGKAAKPSVYYAAKSAEAANAEVLKHLGDAMRVAAAKASRKAAMAADKATWDGAKDLPVGTVLVCSWGWEQTNVDFYKVVGHYGKLGVEMVHVGSKTVEGSGGGHGMSDMVVADPDRVLDDGAVVRARMSSKVGVAVPGHARYSWGTNAHKWDGGSCYRSWYA
jgi:hypothetical protein